MIFNSSVAKQISKVDNEYHEEAKREIPIPNSFNPWLNLDCCWNNSFFGDWVSSLGKRRAIDGNCWFS